MSSPAPINQAYPFRASFLIFIPRVLRKGCCEHSGIIIASNGSAREGEGARFQRKWRPPASAFAPALPPPGFLAGSPATTLAAWEPALCRGLQSPGSHQPPVLGDAGWSVAWGLPREGIRCNVQLGPLQSPRHQAVPRRRDLFPLHLPRLLISCEVHACLSGSRGQLSLISLPCYHHHSPAAARALSAAGRLKGQAGRAAGSLASLQARCHPGTTGNASLKHLPQTAALLPAKRLRAGSPRAVGGPCPQAALRHKRFLQLPQPGGGCRHGARSAAAARG